jgi:peroxiredoxin|tara:strand:- start:592 stop:1137 length:546 start_codon:yes stop_codon:yes gene_type:complete
MEIPKVTFKIREGDLSEDGGCNFDEGCWTEKTSDEIFNNKKIIVFSLPGAFTPTCTSQQLPGYEAKYEDFKAMGIDEVYCVSVNDSFVMNAWANKEGIKNVKVIPDGSGVFTKGMNMLVKKDDKGFGERSWRYAAIIDNGVVEKMFEEPGKEDNCASDPYGESSPETVMKYLNMKNGDDVL